MEIGKLTPGRSIQNIKIGGNKMARSITTRSTNPKIMDDNIKILDDALAIVSAPPAEDVVYDNTDSGLTATDVQDAIDEVFANFSNYISNSVVSENVTFGIGIFPITTGGNTIEVTGIKVVRNWDNRYTVIGMVLSGAIYSTNFIAYSSWNDKLIKISS